MAYTILYPDAKHKELDIEARAVGPDVTLVHARKNDVDAVDRAQWESCDAIVVSRLPMDRKIIPHLKRCRIIVRNGVGFDPQGPPDRRQRHHEREENGMEHIDTVEGRGARLATHHRGE